MLVGVLFCSVVTFLRTALAMTKICLAMKHVHDRKVLHRDIKLDNILLTSEGDVKICDFGVSKLIKNKNQI